MVRTATGLAGTLLLAAALVGGKAYLKMDLASPSFPNGYEAYMLDLALAGALDQDGHVVAG